MDTEKTEKKWIDRWMDELPESKLELIQGKLIINTMAGSRRIMQEILGDYGPTLVLPMASTELWWSALRKAYGPQVEAFQHLSEWHQWADSFGSIPEKIFAGPQVDVRHRQIYGLLKWSLYYLCTATRIGESWGRDMVIKLGEDGLTPDLFFIDRARIPKMSNYYLDGPPTIVIEVVIQASAEQDKVLKLGLYEQAGIPEYWLIEPETVTATFYRLQPDGHYAPVVIELEDLVDGIKKGKDVVYQSEAVPKLSLSILKLWTGSYHDNYENRWEPFRYIRQIEEELPKSARAEGIGWDHIPFAPRVALDPVAIRFEEFASWCGRAKFESYAGGIKIDGSEGMRRVSGMLLMTLGLVDVVQMAHPREWLAFLDPTRYQDAMEQHTQTLMEHATYESGNIPSEEYFYGKITEIDAVSGIGDTQEEAEQDLKQYLQNWVLLQLARGASIPVIDKGIDKSIDS